MNRPPPSVVVAVSGDSLRAQLLDSLLVDRNDYDVIFVESVARGYSRIKQLRPDCVVVFMEIDDVAAYGLLSMLSVDRDVSGTPVVMCVTKPSSLDFEPVYRDIDLPLSGELWT